MAQRGVGSLSHLALVCPEGSQKLLLLLLGHADEVKGAPKLGRYLVEFLGSDSELAMCFF
jgi:hypothetical protein